jgi:hypothetical protein
MAAVVPRPALNQTVGNPLLSTTRHHVEQSGISILSFVKPG